MHSFMTADIYLDSALEALEHRKVERRAVLDALPVPVYLTDPEGRVTYWNRACAEFAGREPWGWKDPRTVLFLEFWRRAIPGLKTLLLWRPCAEVVTSLVDRARASDKPDYQIGSVRAVKTWRAYNERVLAYENDHPQDTVLLPLHALLRDDRAALARIQGRLGLPLEHRPIAEVFEPELLQARAPSLLQRAAMRHWGADTLAAALDQASDRV